MFQALYSKFKTARMFLSLGKNGQHLWGDTTIFGLNYDHRKTGLLEDDTFESGKYPNLVDLYTSYAATSVLVPDD